MNINALGVFFIAFASLLLELNLIRVFDVLWYPNMAYMVITLAVFSFGLAGVFLSVKPIQRTPRTWLLLAVTCVVMALCSIALKPAIDNLPFDYTMLTGDNTGQTLFNFFLIYLVVCIPFFLSGLILSMVFSHYAEQIQRLYFWDLCGAACGCLLIIPLLPLLGTAGILYVVASLALLSAACFCGRQRARIGIILLVSAVLVLAVPLSRDSFDSFTPHMSKRGYKTSIDELPGGSWWDPISKIDVLDLTQLDRKQQWIAYDGGTQSSYFYPFDGDFERLRASLPASANQHFWGPQVAVSHFLKADSAAEVLIVGSAGGQELKAALTYSPAHVDAIELVGTVVTLGKNQYAEYTGNIMNDPRASVQRGEGRSFLRSSNKRYDIIQMFSNHTSSSIAAGSGAMQASYLQTVEAYKEYFTHLQEDGILHINHHVYPRMVAIASRAWAELGRSDFRRHVLVSEAPLVRDDLPTLLIKMSPWTSTEVNQVKAYIPERFRYPQDPSNPDRSFLPDSFFAGKLPASVIDAAPYRIEESTDNKPFFNSLRANLSTLPLYAPEVFVNHGISELLNSQKSSGYPIDVIHLFVTAGAAILFALVFTLAPLLLSQAGRVQWPGKSNFMIYFCSLGMGFIIFELVAIQLFMKLIGYPLYTYTTVLFTFLFGAGMGSLYSDKLGVFAHRSLRLPLIGITLSTALILFSQHFIFDALLQMDVLARIVCSVVMIFPLAFFLGMPFPLGVLAIQHRPPGTIAWAWALNGLFTVSGGIFCAVFSVYFGFMATILVALAAYLIAFLSYSGMQAAAPIISAPITGESASADVAS